MPTNSQIETKTRSAPVIVVSGFAVGTLGGLIGLGGAEFRLPILISVFRFEALRAVIINKATSMIVVASALLFRSKNIPLTSVANRWDVIAILLSGSLVGAWVGASWATRLKSRALYHVLAVLLVLIAVALLLGHNPDARSDGLLTGVPRVLVGALAGFGIGVVASLMGVAGGELLIPTIVLLFGADIRTAGSLSLAVSLPTMIAAFTRYSRDKSFVVIREERRFVVLISVGSFLGALTGGLLLGVVPEGALLPSLAALVVISDVKVWRHAPPPSA
jgi:hypothetical protein